jgi:hypothetical protein
MRLLSPLFMLWLTITILSGQDVSTLQKRTDTLDLARKLLTSQPILVDKNELLAKNPFNPQAVVPAAETSENLVSPTVVVDRELLMSLATLVIPTGAVRLGDKSILLFGQKKLKEGDTLPIVFQGVTHELVIIAIEQTNFTLRLNNEEITRPIKPSAKKP